MRSDATARPPDPLLDELALLSDDEAQAAALLAVDPAGLGGACLRSGPHPWRDAWLARLRGLLPEGAPMRRLPAGTGDTELLGGLDLTATLAGGRPVLKTGLLSQAHGGLVLLAMAERLSAETAAHLRAVLDTGQLQLQREGLARQMEVSIGLVALDEGLDEDEGLLPALRDRLAFWLKAPQPLDEEQALGRAVPTMPSQSAEDIIAARERLALVELPETHLQALCATALALGVTSLRPTLMAARVARVAAALEGHTCVGDQHAALAARLVLAPRATRLPASASADEPDAAPPPEPPSEAGSESPEETPPQEQAPPPSAQELEELMISAVQACLSPGLLAMLRAGQSLRRQRAADGKAGAERKNFRRGRPLGAVRGDLRGGARLHLLATLRAAAPWQRLRKQGLSPDGRPEAGQRIEVRREDFHIRRFRQHSSTTTVFVVDASGSSALHRLAEAKGAVELLLADCYVRRDRVAVLAFRGSQAQLLLPPTRSLARAKRSLAALPGGGGTPLATALEAAYQLAGQIARGGDTPLVVLLTDGRANVARDGSPGRSRAAQEALAAARPFAAEALSCLLIDTSPQPQESARQLAQAMRAHYLPLPHADAHKLSQAVRLALPEVG
ncbi:MAG: magnesium chelatase subunit D [Betaproteobacteria bacterium]|nr:magnesium chelatase subunit D [Betaproteobacteria bacterium]